MSFGREKRMLLGLLALLAPLPLPFNEILSWALLVVYAAVVIVFLHRAWQDPGSWLPAWAMNVLGLIYLPFLWVDLVAFWGSQMVRPLIHLALFAVVVKLFSLRREVDKWQTLAAIFFLFLASMATSVHPSVIVYLVAMIVVGSLLLARFAAYSVLGRFGYRTGALARVPLGGFIAAATVAAFLVSVPLFALLPRIKTPYILGSGGLGSLLGASGFSDVVTLDSIGNTRLNREVVLRLRFEPEAPGEIRLRAASFARFDGRLWQQSDSEEGLRPQRQLVLGDGPPVRSAEVYLLPLRSRSVPLPVEAVTLEMMEPKRLLAESGGGLRFAREPLGVVGYRVEMGRSPTSFSLPGNERPGPATLDAEAVSPRMAALARQVVEEGGSDRERAVRLERFLSTSYDYSLDSLGRGGATPLEDFLFETRRGHCEYFASSMVLLLRSQGIPARLVTGFLGADRNRLEGYYMVRQSNAHAWVEAWIEGEGWRFFDPTPPAGRPGTIEGGVFAAMREAYDFLVFRWDRYVLTFGLQDQLALAQRLRGAWSAFWSRFDRPEDPSTVGPEEIAAATTGSGEEAGVRPSRRWPWLVALLAVAGAVIGLLAWLRGRFPPTAREAYSRLRRGSREVGVAVPDSLAPLAFAHRLGERFPQTAEPTARLVRLYLAESYDARDLDGRGRAALHADYQAVREVLRRAG